MSSQGHLWQLTLCQCARYQTPLTIFVFSFQAAWMLLIFWEGNYKGHLLVYRWTRWLCPFWKLSGPEAGWTDDTQVIMGALDTTTNSQMSEYWNTEMKLIQSLIEIVLMMLCLSQWLQQHFLLKTEVKGTDAVIYRCPLFKNPPLTSHFLVVSSI